MAHINGARRSSLNAGPQPLQLSSIMRLIAVETSGLFGSVALADGPRVLEEVRLTEGLRHARDLLVVVRDACLRAGWAPRSVEAVAVSIGPGSFTGLRISVTFAKTVAWDTGAKVVAVPTLRALAENAPADRVHVATILDAKRYGLYTSLFERRGDEVIEVFGPLCLAPQALAERLPADTFILGRGITVAREALARFDLSPESLWDVRPSVVARMGLEKLKCGDLADPLRLEPVYLRKPEAEEIWERRKGSN